MRYYIGTETEKYTSLWATIDKVDDDILDDLGMIEVGWFDFWMYRLFRIIPPTQSIDTDI